MTVPFPRTVKPRVVRPTDFLPLIVVDEHSAFIERTGEVVPVADLHPMLRDEPSSIFVVANASWLLWEFHNHLQDDPYWQYRVTPLRREFSSWRTTGRSRKTKTLDTVVNYFGFKSEQRKKAGHWHFTLDPMIFARVKTTELLDGDGPYLARILAWGQDVRAWCQANRLRITPTAGGLAGQLLRDPRFYPEVRRKVPRATNARAREVLPGNYYRLYAPENISVDGVYLDMASAHHNVALETTFPSSNGLLARGDFRVTDATDSTVPECDPWISNGTPSYKRAIAAHGLFLLRVAVPTVSPDRFPPPFMEHPGRRLAWVYSNELPTLQELGGYVEGIEAAWTAAAPDPGLNKYAAWALTELATMDQARKRWAKPTLLATYGILAAKPRTSEFGYLHANGGTPREYPAGHGTLPVMAHVSLTEQEIQTANVIHRGMIEAGTRKRCLDLARELTGYGCDILAIYADAVFVKAGTPLPLLSAPWVVKQELTRLKFFNPTSFASDQMTRLPGVPREGRDRIRRLESVRRMQ